MKRWLRRAAMVIAALSAILIFVLPRFGAPPPISIPAATAHWVNEREFDITAPAYYWSDTCLSIWVNWWVQTRWHGAVPVTTRAVVGPFAAKGPMPPRYPISITPKVGAALQLRVTIPDWLSPEDVLLVAVDDTVPDNEPCASGWTGVMQVFRLQIDPAAASAPVLPSPKTARPGHS
jgi:hypothetical protein